MKNTALSRCLIGAAIGIASVGAAMAQTTTVPATGTSSPAGRDAQGHAADSTAPAAHSKGMKMDKSDSSTSSDTGMKMTKPRTNTTPVNTTPGAGLRNGGDTVPPTSGASGR